MLFFLPIRHTERRASSFFLYFTFLFQILPITSIYGLGKYSSGAYYNLLCLSFLVCELVTSYTGKRPMFRRTFPLFRAMTLSFTTAAALLIAYIVWKKMTPQGALLDASTAYEYRTSNAFQSIIYMSYMLRWTISSAPPRP